MKDPLFEFLQPVRRSAVVDIGANPIDNVPPYKPMLDQGICTVVGFDPQKSAIEQLKQKTGSLETYLPYAVADGTDQTLYTCMAPGMTSILKPDAQSLSLFPLFEEFGKVVASEQIHTRALDNIEEIENIDFLKIDVQGAELSVFRSGRNKLAKAVAIQTEVSFLPLYEDQPTIGLIDVELRSQGFIPHALAELKQWIISPLLVDKNPRRPLNQLIEADFVYVRDFRHPDKLTEEQLKHLALISHHCYQSFDLALFCLVELERRGCLPRGVERTYINMLGARAQA
jgi:FkbM family methyltransferase